MGLGFQPQPGHFLQIILGNIGHGDLAKAFEQHHFGFFERLIKTLIYRMFN